MPWNSAVLRDGLVSTGSAPTVAGFPLFTVYSNWLAYIDVGGTPIPESNTRYWNKPTYPISADTTYSTVSALNTALQSASADNKVLFLEDGASSGNITIPSARTGVTICPETRNGVNLTNSDITVNGSFCNVMGFYWLNGGGELIELIGSDNVVAYNTIDGPSGSQWIRVQGGGDRCRICYNSFLNKDGNGQPINVTNGTGPGVTPIQYVRSDHNWIDNMVGASGGGSEQIQYGQSSYGDKYYGLIDNNWFSDHNPPSDEQESMTIKSDGLLFIQNVMDRCGGRWNIRAGAECCMYANWIFADGLADARGFSLNGLDCIVACNYIDSINDADVDGYMAIGFGEGISNPDNYGPGDYVPAHNAEASFNTIRNSKKCIRWGFPGSGTSPNNTKFYNNIVEKTGSANAITDTSWGTTPTFGGNVMEPTVGHSDSGITAETPELTLDTYYVPTTGLNCDGTGVNSGYNGVVSVDILGNPIPASNPNPGCFQSGWNFSTDPVQAIRDNAGAAA